MSTCETGHGLDTVTGKTKHGLDTGTVTSETKHKTGHELDMGTGGLGTSGLCPNITSTH